MFQGFSTLPYPFNPLHPVKSEFSLRLPMVATRDRFAWFQLPPSLFELWRDRRDDRPCTCPKSRRRRDRRASGPPLWTLDPSTGSGQALDCSTPLNRWTLNF